MTLLQLEYIAAVEKYGSFVTAAKACGVTQPTLTKQVQDLEIELNVKLFDRSTLPVTITEIGQAIVEQARSITRDADGIYRLAKVNKPLSSRRKRAATGK